MADNLSVTPGNGKTVAADDVDGVLHQRVKLSVGADGEAVDMSAGAGAVDGATPRVTLANDDPAVAKLTTLDASALALTKAVAGNYETVAASQTDQVLGSAGAAGDYLAGLLIIPATTSPGAVAILDDATSINVFAGGASSVGDLKPFFLPLGLVSSSGAWKVTTGANVSVVAVGKFT